MARKIIPAGQFPGDVTFKLGEATKYSQPLKRGSKSPARKRVAPTKSPTPSARKRSEPASMSVPEVKDNTPSIATTSKTFTGNTPSTASSPKSPSSVRRVFKAPPAIKTGVPSNLRGDTSGPDTPKRIGVGSSRPDTFRKAPSMEGDSFTPLRQQIRQTGTKTSVAIQEGYNKRDRRKR